MAECDRKRAVAQNDDGGRRFIWGQKRVCEGEREARIGLIGVHHLAVPSLHCSRPIGTIGSRGRYLRLQRPWHQADQSENSDATKATEEASARRDIIRVASEIDHVLLHSWDCIGDCRICAPSERITEGLTDSFIGPFSHDARFRTVPARANISKSSFFLYDLTHNLLRICAHAEAAVTDCPQLNNVCVALD